MEEIKDAVVGGVKGILATMPVGSVVMSIAQEVQNGILQRRFEDWKEKVDEKLGNLEEEIRHKLPDNEIFATVLLLSAQMAIKTNDEKRSYLANAVKNAATTNISEDRIVVLLNCIDKYTLTHLKLLRFLKSPGEYKDQKSYYMTASTMGIFKDCYPKEDNLILKVAITDMYSDVLINNNSLNTTQTIVGAFAPQTTDLGNDFIQFFGIDKIV